MTIIILGVNGMLGSMLYFVTKTKHPDLNPIGLSKSEFDVLNDDIHKLDEYVHENSCTIINCIGAIPQKKYTDEEYNKINVTFPNKLANYCQTKNIKLIHISTNCVFSGNKDMCIETDTPDASDVYGKTKYLGEPSYGLTIRCSIVGLEKHTFCGLMEWFLNTNLSQVNGFIDSYWNGITTLELSKIIINHIVDDSNTTNLLHYYSENSLSKYNILGYLNQKFSKNILINKKENGLKYYTLSSIYTKHRKSIYLQIDELADIYDEYKTFYNLK